MLNLIKNEIIKTFKKKSMLVLLIITLGFVGLTNFIYHSLYDGSGSINIEVGNDDVSYLKEEIKNLNLKNRDDLMDYISYKTDIDVAGLKKKYKSTSWQYYVLENNIYNTIYDMNYYTYSDEKDDNIVKEKRDIYEIQMNKLKKGNWKYFVNEELTSFKEELKEVNISLKNETNKNKIAELTTQLEVIKLNIEKQQYRLDNNISYANSYLNRALESYYSIKIDNLSYNEEKANYSEKREHNDVLNNMAKAKYALDNKVNTFSDNNLRGIFINFFNEYGMIILVGIVMIAGSIVSEEFSKGTIKLLLIRPHSRIKILVSKLLTTIISIFIIFGVVALLQFIIGGVFFGFNSLNIPVVVYNFNTNAIQTYNIFSYLLLMFIVSLPKYMLLATLAFCVSTIFKNTSLGTSIGIMGYIASEIVNMLVIANNIKILKYFVTLNWNFEEYLFGGLPAFKYVSLPFSIIICIVYFIIMLVPTFIIFKKTNIKNT